MLERRQSAPSALWLTVAITPLCTVLKVAAQDAAAQPDVDAEVLEELSQRSMEELLETPVAVATGSTLSLAQTPAVVTVITERDLQSSGCRSLADALQLVPGFYGVDNLVYHNFGVRGVNGGVGAAGSILKVMIDGQSISYLPTTGNFFDRELIPIEAVERIEVLRGPASALYGAGAFLGVINIITRHGGRLDGARTTVGGGMVRGRPGAEASVMVSAGTENADLLAAVSAARIDRSGLGIAASSPLLDLNGIAQERSRDDVSRPQSMFFKARVGRADTWGELEGLSSLQMLDARAEFDELDPLTHVSRVVRENRSTRVRYTKALGEYTTVRASGAYLASRAGRDRLVAGSEERVLARVESARGFEANVEATIDLWEAELKLGGDYRVENHRPVSFDEILLEDVVGADGMELVRRGTRIRTANPKRRKLTNIGGYVQLHVPFLARFSATVGLRLDQHNLYGTQPSPRAALVYAPPMGKHYAKLSYGASFKSPSVEQLYAEAPPSFAMTDFGRGRIGSEVFASRTAFSTGRMLKYQRAHVLEAAFGAQVGDWFALGGNTYVTQIEDRVQYEPNGLFLVARNVAPERFVGAELEATFTFGSRFTARVSGTFVEVLPSPNPDDSTLGSQKRAGASFPPYSIATRTSYTIPWLELRVSPELLYYAPRPASDINAAIAGEKYDLDAYLLANLAVYGQWEFWLRHPSELSLRIDNLFNGSYADPGYHGYDVPALGIRAFLSLSQQF